MGGRAEGLACADPGARTPLGASGNSCTFSFTRLTFSIISCLSFFNGSFKLSYILYEKELASSVISEKATQFWVS
jgi:hypothetical protein